jgi:hypothetical protein
MTRRPQPRLPDQLVVGVEGPVAKPPGLFASEVEQRAGIAFVAVRQFGERDPEGRLFPPTRFAHALAAGGDFRPVGAVGKLPVGDAARVGEDRRGAGHRRRSLGCGRSSGRLRRDRPKRCQHPERDHARADESDASNHIHLPWVAAGAFALDTGDNIFPFPRNMSIRLSDN